MVNLRKDTTRRSVLEKEPSVKFSDASIEVPVKIERSKSLIRRVARAMRKT